jgi:hypothetical protein
MRNSGAVKARYSASLPVSQARIIQLDAEIIAAVLSAIAEHNFSGQHYKSSEKLFGDDRGGRCAGTHACMAALCAATLPPAIIARRGESAVGSNPRRVEKCSKSDFSSSFPLNLLELGFI